MTQTNTPEHDKIRYHALRLIFAERFTQIAKWGVLQNISPTDYLSILMEEVGEVSQAINQHVWGEGTAQSIYDELVQVGAVTLAMLEYVVQTLDFQTVADDDDNDDDDEGSDTDDS